MPTARSPTSGENSFDLFVALSSQGLEPPQNRGVVPVLIDAELLRLIREIIAPEQSADEFIDYVIRSAIARRAGAYGRTPERPNKRLSDGAKTYNHVAHEILWTPI
jgi:hypothetical protein